MDDTKIRELVRTGTEAFNEADWNRWREVHAPSVVYDEVATGRRLTGHQEVLDVLEGWKTAVPDARGEITHLMVIGNQAVYEITWRGTHRGEMKTPTGVIPPSGNPIEVRAVMISRIDDERIVENRQYFDFMTLLQQMGGVPESRTKAAGA